MGAKNQIIEGDYKNKLISSNEKEIWIVLGWVKRLILDKTTVKDIEVLSSEEKISGTSAVARGVLGAFVLGSAGLLAATSAKKKGVHLVAVEFQDGKKSLMEVDEKIYKKLLILNF